LATETETRRQWPAEFAKTSESLLAAPIPADLEFAFPGDLDFDVVALFQVEGFDDSGGQANRQALAPFGYLHTEPPRIYIPYCISRARVVSPEVLISDVGTNGPADTPV
jgi:hypothetical protein